MGGTRAGHTCVVVWWCGGVWCVGEGGGCRRYGTTGPRDYAYARAHVIVDVYAVIARHRDVAVVPATRPFEYTHGRPNAKPGPRASVASRGVRARDSCADEPGRAVCAAQICRCRTAAPTGTRWFGTGTQGPFGQGTTYRTIASTLCCCGIQVATGTTTHHTTPHHRRRQRLVLTGLQFAQTPTPTPMHTERGRQRETHVHMYQVCVCVRARVHTVLAAAGRGGGGGRRRTGVVDAAKGADRPVVVEVADRVVAVPIRLAVAIEAVHAP